ncbi:phosphoadenosine phosphosulfate reductase family protein [Robiginitalea sp. M366]|uniref:phosphoadenosine phosphosulfate reductase family protein n=1 Tax=Robiginitalea aestuariiviva TaxID=3036903 RepID=UPI00240D0CFA|nr:phosphoadenosine phosphosulfate reductase family protein [Robiginitalea aestuariiviva]MDG1571398.1 phosphoadenosine phosphosulfate reductase family protein [Robiginitalea aestuariiviva]
MSNVRHVLGISGGKDSAALAIYLHEKYPQIDFEYYFCDTGKELDETYQLIEKLESYLGKSILKLENEELHGLNEDPFDYYYKIFRGYLPSSQARWCTAMMKLKPFENFVQNDPTLSYVGIRGDEDREGYISRQENIQSIFPFRKNIWSVDVLNLIFNPSNIDHILDCYNEYLSGDKLDYVHHVFSKPIPFDRNRRAEKNALIKESTESLLNLGVPEFNHVVFKFLKSTNYSVALLDDFPLLDNEDVLIRDDIFKILEERPVGVPKYYEKIPFEVDGQKGEYARSRSGCYFCFFQQKIEWVWLYEQHPNLFRKAMHYENVDEHFTWTSDESLEELIQPERIRQIKLDHIHRSNREKSNNSPFLIDILEGTERDGCNTCFL